MRGGRCVHPWKMGSDYLWQTKKAGAGFRTCHEATAVLATDARGAADVVRGAPAPVLSLIRWGDRFRTALRGADRIEWR